MLNISNNNSRLCSWAPSIIISAFLSVISLPSLASAQCSDLTGCEQKFCEINKQLTIAQQQNNPDKIAGLETALRQAKANCTNDKLKQNVIDKINGSKQDIAEYDADLIEAESAGKADKVTKYQKKIAEEENKIKYLKSELSTLNK